MNPRKTRDENLTQKAQKSQKGYCGRNIKKSVRSVKSVFVMKISVISVRSNYRVSLFFSRYFAINIMTVYAMEWECENTRKSENHAKIDIAAAISL